MQIRRTTIPYKGRSRWGAEGTKKTRRSTSVYTSGGGGAGGGNGINITPTGTATCYVDVSTSYIYDDTLPATISMNVIGEVDNQRRPTYVQTQNITGGYPSMTITVTDNGTDHAVLRVTLPSGFNQSGMLTIPVMVNAATGQDIITPIGTQTMEEAFTARSKTTRVIDCYWEYSVLHMGSDGTVTRGPVMWSSSLARRFSNGVGPEAQDRVYMDLIKRAGDRNTYKCITSYTQTAGQTWDQVSANWQMDNTFNIIASGLIMGTDATIELKEDNQIVVYNGNDDDVVTIDSNGINSNHIFSSDVTTLGLTMKDGSLNTTATLASDGSLTTVGTVRTSGPVISTSVQTGSLRSNDITAVGTITGNKVVGTSVEAGSLRSNDITAVGTITGNKVVGTSVQTDSLRSNDITAVGTITGNKVVGTSVQTDSLRSNDITAVGTITGNKVVGTSVQTDNLRSNNITAVGTITAGPVISSSLNTGNITSVGTVSASNLTGTTIDGGKLTLNSGGRNYATIDTAGLSIGTVSTTKVETGSVSLKNGLTQYGTISTAGLDIGTVNASNLIGTSVTAGSMVFRNGGSNYASIGTSGLRIGTVNADNATARGLTITDNGTVVTTLDNNGITTGSIECAGIDARSVRIMQNSQAVAVIDDNGIFTVGTMEAPSVVGTSISAVRVDASTIDAVGTITAGPVISSSLNTGDITSVGTVTSSKLVAATVESGGITLKDNGTQYAVIDTTGLQIGTVTTSRLKGNSIKVLNDSGAQYAEFTNGNGLQIGTIMTSKFKTNNLMFVDTSNVQYATMGSSGLNISTITTRGMSFMNANNTSFGNISPTNGLVINKVKSDSMETKGVTIKNLNQQVKLTLDSNGNVSASGNITGVNVSGTNMAAENYRIKDVNYPNTYMTTTSNNLGLSIGFVTDEKGHFDNTGTYWVFNGVETKFEVAAYPYVTANSNGEYVLMREDGVFDESNVRTGVYNSTHTRSRGRIYFDMDNQDITVGALSYVNGAPKV